MNIDSMTFGELKQIAALFGTTQSKCACPMLVIGKGYLVQLATGYMMSGRIKEDNADHYVLTKAAWVADTGRFGNAIKLSEFSEVEAFDRDLIITKQSIVMAVEILKDQEVTK